MKKINQKIVIKLGAIALLILMIVTFTHCVPQIAKEVGNGGGPVQNQITTTAGPKEEGQIIKETQVTTGVKSHEQILYTMAAVTGINPYAVASIMTVYRQVELSLPTDNNIKVFSSTQQVAVTKLAAEFCFVLSNDATARSAIWPGMNFAAAYDTFFSTQNKPVFIQNMISIFWGPMLTNEELQGTYQDLDDLIVMLKQNAQDQPENNNTATLRAVRGACTSALSSAYVTLL
jgi:hypothetical protein